MSKYPSVKGTGTSFCKKIVFLENPRKNIWHKLKKYSKIGQGFQNVVFNFACFFSHLLPTFYFWKGCSWTLGLVSTHIRYFSNLSFFLRSYVITQFRMGIFATGAKKTPLPKICHTYPTIKKLGKVIPYIKKTQKIHESRDTPPVSADISSFSLESTNFLMSINTDIQCILIHNFYFF